MLSRSVLHHYQHDVPILVSGISSRQETESSSGRDCAKTFLGFRSPPMRGRGSGLGSLRYCCPLDGGIFNRCSFESRLRARTLSMGGGFAPMAAAVIPMQSKLTERDGIVIVDHGSRRAQSNAMLHEFVKLYKEKTGRLVVEAAHMELADPTISDAFDRCVEQGATRVIISPYFLFPGRHWDKDIPTIAAEAAKKHPNTAYIVTAPIGLHELMVNVISDRMEYCLSQVAGEALECDMCSGSGRCKQLTSLEHQAGADSVPTSGKEHFKS